MPLKIELQLDTEAENFTKIINSTVGKYTINYERRDPSISYPVEIHVKIEKKRKARKRWQQTRYPAYKTILNRLTHELIAAIKKHKQKSISGYLKKFSADKANDYSLWKATRKIKRLNIQSSHLKSDGIWGRTNENKGNMFADYFEKHIPIFYAANSERKYFSH